MSLRFTLRLGYVFAFSIFNILLYRPGNINFTVISAAVVFYNAPTPAPGIFDDFLAIPTNQSDVNTRSFLDMFSSLAFINPPNTVRCVITQLLAIKRG